MSRGETSSDIVICTYRVLQWTSDHYYLKTSHKKRALESKTQAFTCQNCKERSRSMKVGVDAISCTMVLWFTLVAIAFMPPATSFFVALKTRTVMRSPHKSQEVGFHQPLWLAAKDDEPEDSSVSSEGNFDGKGFAGYLGPYIAAFAASIAVTAAFVKFVLLDY
jgi:hypothetical protein